VRGERKKERNGEREREEIEEKGERFAGWIKKIKVAMTSQIFNFKTYQKRVQTCWNLDWNETRNHKNIFDGNIKRHNRIYYRAFHGFGQSKLGYGGWNLG